jgi:hypothetical protein
MKISPPLGYEQIVPLQKGHRVVLPRADEVPDFCRRLHVVPVSLAEFGPACRDYPIVFVSPDSGKTFTAVAVLGLQVKQNLFVLTDGTWDRRAYLPVYVRRHPFCISRNTRDGDTQSDQLICVEESALKDGGEPLYDESGNPLPQWLVLERLILDFENDLMRCEEMCKLLADLQLLESFSMKAELDGFTMALEGMHRVSQTALESLPEKPLRKLLSAGVMDKVYAHLLSLDNFRRLLNRRSFFAVTPPRQRRELN